MTCKAQQAVDAMDAALKTINQEAGYFTNIGQSIYQGFYVQALRNPDIQFPFVSLQPDYEQIDELRPGVNKAKVLSATRLVIAAENSAEASSQLRNALSDVRRALMNIMPDVLPGIGIRDSLQFGTAEYALSTDANLSLAALPVSVSFVEN